MLGIDAVVHLLTHHKNLTGLQKQTLKIGGRIINKVRFADDTAIIAKTQEELEDMGNRLVDTGRKHGIEINIDKSQV